VPSPRNAESMVERIVGEPGEYNRKKKLSMDSKAK